MVNQQVSFKEHPDYVGLYVSQCGKHIWFIGHTIGHKSQPLCCKKANIHKDRYGYLVATMGNKAIWGKTLRQKVHQLVAQTWIDNPNELKYVNHKDYDKTNNHRDNLEWVSLAQNNKGKHRKVSHVPSNKRLAALRLMVIDGLTIKEAAFVTGITTNTLCDGRKGRTWKNEWKKLHRLSEFSE